MNIRRWGLIASLAFVIVMASGASPVFGEEGGDNTIPGRYIVVFKDHVGNPGASAREHARKHRFELTHIYKKALKGFSARLSSRTLKILSADPSVALVEPDRQVWALPQPLSTGVDRIDADLNATAAIDGGGNPLNVNVAIIDTGVDLDHEDLRVRPAGEGFASYALILGSSISCGFYQDTPDDGHGHGSHVAGIVGAVKGGEKVYHCGGGIVYHRHDEKGLNWEPGGIRSGAGVRSSGVSQESTGSSDTWEAALCRLCLRR